MSIILFYTVSSKRARGELLENCDSPFSSCSPSENVGEVQAEFIRQMVLAAAAAQVPDTDWQKAYE